MTLSTPIGVLIINEVFIEYDGPRVCACESVAGQLFMGFWVEEEPSFDEWLFVPVSRTRLSRIRTGEVSLRESIEGAEDGWFWCVRIPFDGSDPSARRLEISDVNPEHLPAPGTRLSLQDDRLPKEEFEPAVEAVRARRDVVILRLKTAFKDLHIIEAEHLGSVLLRFQSVIERLGYTGMPSKGRLPRQVVRDHTLLVTGFVKGSFGVRCETLSTGNLFGETNASSAIAQFMELVQASHDRDALLTQIKKVHPGAAVRYHLFLRELSRSNIALDASWGSPANAKRSALLSSDTIRTALGVFSEEGEVLKVELVLHGVLVGIIADKKHFEFVSDAGDRYRGEYVHGFLEGDGRLEQLEELLQDGLSGVVKIQEIIEVNPATGQEQFNYILLKMTLDSGNNAG